MKHECKDCRCVAGSLSATLLGMADNYRVPSAKEYRAWAARAAQLENALQDAAGWNPSPVPAEIRAEWKRLATGDAATGDSR